MEYIIMKKQETKKGLEVKKEISKKLENYEKEIDVPRLTSDYLDQTLQIA